MSTSPAASPTPIWWRSMSALERLALEDPRKARVVELRFFGGLSMEEVAQTLGVSLRTVHNDWAFARAWLYRALTSEAVMSSERWQHVDRIFVDALQRPPDTRAAFVIDSVRR